MFWQLASMSGFLSFGSCAIGILRNLFAATLPRLPKHPPKLFQLPISCRKTRSQPLGLQSEQLLPTRKHSPYFPITSDEAHCDCHPAGGRQRSRAHQGVNGCGKSEETAIHTLY